MSSHDVVGAASWRARETLGFPRLVEGHRADIVCFELDPRRNLESLRAPDSIVINGGVVVQLCLLVSLPFFTLAPRSLPQDTAMER